MRSDRRITFAPEAEDDLRSLLADTYISWGETQLRAYADRLLTTTRSLTAYPHMGRTRDDLMPGMRSLPAGHHVIYYVADEETVLIFRFLHERMDPARHIRPPQ